MIPRRRRARPECRPALWRLAALGLHALIATGIATGCKQAATPAADGSTPLLPAAQSSAVAGATARAAALPPAPAPDAGVPALTAAKLDAWLALQRALLSEATSGDAPGEPTPAGHGGPAADSGAAEKPANAADAGPSNFGEGHAASRSLDRQGFLARAWRAERLRADAGLDEAELDTIEDLVASLVVARELERLADVDPVADYSSVAGRLRGEDRARLQAALGVLSAIAAADAGAPLAELVARFGDANVALVLAREAELTRAWGLVVGQGRPER